MQSLFSHQSSESILNEAMLLFDQQQYIAAQNLFESYLDSNKQKYRREAVAYYRILCALKNNDPYIETLIQHFLVSYPSSVQGETIRYRLAKLYFEQNLFDKALSIFQEINISQLNDADRLAFPYEIANTYLQLKHWNAAKEIFSHIKDSSHPYWYRTKLRLAYIAFKQANYTQAIAQLQEAKEDTSQLLGTRRLMLQVYHKSRAFESLLAYVKDIPVSDFTQLDQLLIADAYFFLKKYKEAIIYYQNYLGSDICSDRASGVKLGYALYAIEAYPQALICFQQLMSQEDLSGQIAAYYSGLIYKKGDKTQSAIDAFDKASMQKFDLEIEELACIKRAGMRYQQGLVEESIQDIDRFIRDHQESKNISVAQALLVQCYYVRKDYKKAVNYIAELPYKNEMLLKLYQQVLFCQGVETYNAGMLDGSIKYFKQSLLFPFKTSLLIQSQFWLGEAYSGLSAYNKALKWYAKVQQQSDFDALYHGKTLYGMAYAYFNTENYTTAIKTFEEYIAMTQKEPSATHYDSILRLGDCYYVKKNYEKALQLYASVYTYYPAHVRYQEALIHQILGNTVRASECLKEIMTVHRETAYYTKALYHQACTIFNQGNYEEAMQKFSFLIQREATSDLHPELLMKRALSYENLNKHQEAAADYIVILDQYPTHFHAESALMALSNLCTEQGNPDQLDAYLKKYANVSQKISCQSDAHMIDMAKKLLYNQDYHKVLQTLKGFLQTYSQSPFLAEAYFLMAESYYRLENFKQAVCFYKKVDYAETAVFHIKSWLRIADLAYQNKRFQEALRYYQKLHKIKLSAKEYYCTLMGLIQSSFELKQYQTTIPICLQLINNPKEVPLEMVQKARLYLGKIAMQRAEYKNAKNHFFQASKLSKTATATEAQYLLANAEFKIKAYNASLNALFDLIEKFPYNKKYLDQAFFMLADNYVNLGNLEQAKETLNSIINQSKNKKNIQLAKQRKAVIGAKLKKRMDKK